MASTPPLSSSSSAPLSTAMDSAALRLCPKCHRRMSSLKHDSHTLCSQCRDVVCALDTRCSECKDWPIEIIQEYVKHRKPLAGKKGKKPAVTVPSSQPALSSNPVLDSPPPNPAASEDSKLRDAVKAVLQSLDRSGSLGTNPSFSAAPSMVTDVAPSVEGAAGGGEGMKPHNVSSLYQSSGVGAIDNSAVSTTLIVLHDIYNVYPPSVRQSRSLGTDFAAPVFAPLGPPPPPLASSGDDQLRVSGVGHLASSSSYFSPNSLLFPLPSPSLSGLVSSSDPSPSLSGLVSSSDPSPSPFSSTSSSSSSLSSFPPLPLLSFAPSSLSYASFPSSPSVTFALPPSVSSVFPSSSSSASLSFPSLSSSSASLSFPSLPSSSSSFPFPGPATPSSASSSSSFRSSSSWFTSHLCSSFSRSSSFGSSLFLFFFFLFSCPSSSSCPFLFFFGVVDLLCSGRPPVAVVGSLSFLSVASPLVCGFWGF